MADSFIPYTLSLPNFVPNFKTLSQVVPEKALTEIKLTDRYTNIVTEKAKTIYPLYTSYAGCILMLQLQMLLQLHLSIML